MFRLFCAVSDFLKAGRRVAVSGFREPLFCRTKNIADEVAAMLNVQAYHSYTSLTDRERIMDKWVNGTNKIMVCTSILGAGVDHRVLDVVHCDVGWNMIDQVQEDNRAGRNKTNACVIYFIPEDLAAKNPPDMERFGSLLLRPWALDREQCRRFVPSLYLDGVAVTCITMEGEVELCDNCARAMLDPDAKPPAIPIQTPISSLQTATPSSDIQPKRLEFTPVDKGKGRAVGNDVFTQPRYFLVLYFVKVNKIFVAALNTMMRGKNTISFETVKTNCSSALLTSPKHSVLSNCLRRRPSSYLICQLCNIIYSHF
jgi:hypothetical protein